MAYNASNLNLKNSVFKDLFSDEKYLLRLYRDLYPKDEEVTADDITDVTLLHVFNGDVFNYLGFKVGRRLLLILSQTTWTNDIVYRTLCFMSDTLKQLLESLDEDMSENDDSEFSEPDLAFPILYLVYGGDRENVPDTLSFAEKYFGGKKNSFDFSIRVLSKTDDKTIFGQYIFFCKTFIEQRQLHGNSKRSILNTLDICKKNNILTEYIESREQEVTKIMFDLFYQEEAIETHDMEIKFEKAREIAGNFIKENIPLEIIEKCTKLSMDDLKEIEAEIKADSESE